MSAPLELPAAALRAAITTASAGLVDRETLVELVALAAVAGEHVLVVGPPGTAKSEAVRRVAGALGGRYFEYLLGRFTEPTEIFGPVDLRRLREHHVLSWLPEYVGIVGGAAAPGGGVAVAVIQNVVDESPKLRCTLKVFVGKTVRAELPWPLPPEPPAGVGAFARNDAWLATCAPADERGVVVALRDAPHYGERLRIALEGAARASIVLRRNSLCVADDQGRVVVAELDYGDTRLLHVTP